MNNSRILIMEAEKLGISERVLRYKLKKFKIKEQ